MDMTKTTMKAAVLGKFGGPEEFQYKKVSVPDIASNEVLLHLEFAGVGEWDTFEREGGYAEMLDLPQEFPYILGSEGAGTIVAVGEGVFNFHVGDKVYGPGFLNPKGGFYAEYVAIDAKYLSVIPATISIQEAATISGAGLTALRGLEDVLNLKKEESIIIFGASGGVGHLAVQLAKKIGAKVFAVASGEDGVSLVKDLGADVVINGREEDIVSAAYSFAPDGFDTALLTAGGEAAEDTIQCVRNGGRIAYPFGIYPEPQARTDKTITGYHGEPDSEIINRLNRYIQSGNLQVKIQQIFPLEDAQAAHRALANHYLGKLCFKINGSV